ncbi:MAG: hypothetical protein LBT26_10010 [Clostridiales Family XIII bacterium]|jgi:hypothetical protein|nr:hypothetical protein [Clostridiales Family XIII bacterium]
MAPCAAGQEKKRDYARVTMNRIQAKQILSFKRSIASIFIDECPLGEYLSKNGDSSYEDLWCAWLLPGDGQDGQDGQYIWTLLNEKRNCNLPVLLCPDDMDFWCTIIVAQVRFYEDTVVWERIGLVKEAIDVKQWRESGIQNIEKWSKSDREMYGDILQGAGADDKIWEKWWSEHWADEETRRLWNYFHVYFNNDENIQWLDCERLVFRTNDYDTCVSAFPGSY